MDAKPRQCVGRCCQKSVGWENSGNGGIRENEQASSGLETSRGATGRLQMKMAADDAKKSETEDVP